VEIGHTSLREKDTSSLKKRRGIGERSCANEEERCKQKLAYRTTGDPLLRPRKMPGSAEESTTTQRRGSPQINQKGTKSTQAGQETLVVGEKTVGESERERIRKRQGGKRHHVSWSGRGYSGEGISTRRTLWKDPLQKRKVM